MRKWCICAVILLVAVAVAGASAGDQKRESQLRTVLGTVVDKQDAPLPSSVVYLKNLRTMTVKTHIADDTGHYRFSGLDPNVDYEIYAEHQDLVSAKRTISSFDSRKEIVINLKVDKKKSEK